MDVSSVTTSSAPVSQTAMDNPKPTASNTPASPNTSSSTSASTAYQPPAPPPLPPGQGVRVDQLA